MTSYNKVYTFLKLINMQLFFSYSFKFAKVSVKNILNYILCIIETCPIIIVQNLFFKIWFTYNQNHQISTYFKHFYYLYFKIFI